VVEVVVALVVTEILLLVKHLVVALLTNQA
jgi:hypothetical protein